MSASQTCFHCQLPLPEQQRWSVEIYGEPRPMCCPGCAAAAQAIVDLGLGDYYRNRTAAPERPEPLDALREAELAVWDDRQLADSWAPFRNGFREAVLSIEGMRCPACAWLVERSLQALPGVVDCNVNYQTDQAVLRWNPQQCSLGTLLKQVRRAGYRASPWRPDQQTEQNRRDERDMLIGLGISGIGTMQVMMYAAGLYIGDWQGLDNATSELLRAGSMVIATLVLLFASRIFFAQAIRQIRAGRPGMDVPVALAIGSAYTASLWHTWTGSGEVYFDSVSMFTFFLLLGRYLELRARQHAGANAGDGNLLPAHAWLLENDQPRAVPAVSLQAGMHILVRPGDCCPADGRVLDGSSHVDESLLTGEATPIPRTTGDFITAGSMNLDQPLQLEVTAAGMETRAAAIERTLAQASASKPDIEVLADRVAELFVPGILLLTASVWVIWKMIAPDRAFDVALSVLVVTCPCALSLATPAALTAATRALRQAGVLITGARALDTLADVNRVLFDKTGTLTEGRMQLASVIPLADLNETQCLRLAAALEAHDEHTIARALHATADPDHPTQATQVVRAAGEGIAGVVEGRRLRIGRPDYAAPGKPPQRPAQSEESLAILLADDLVPLAWLLLDDRLRPDAGSCVAALQDAGLHCGILSGDSSERCQRYGNALGISDCHGECSPEQKLQHLHHEAELGNRVLMIGDGLNDAPGLQAAAVSMAMGGGSDLSRARADAILLNDRLASIPLVIEHARRTRSIVHQNLGWALLYNLCAVPVAACGLIPPWTSALGMSASSLLVTLNALRLSVLPARPESKL